MQDERYHNKTAVMHSGMREKEKEVAAFVAYWASMRKGHDVPKRTDIDPRGIEPLLENAFIAEKIAPGLARLRIAGTHLSDLMGMEVRGMPISAFIAPNQRDELSDLLVDLFDRPAILKIELESVGNIGRQPLKGTLLMLPMRSDLGDTSRALGCLVTNGMVGRTPLRFKISGHSLEPVGSAKAGDCTASSGASALESLTEPKLPFSSIPPKHPSERPYLRIVPPESED